MEGNRAQPTETSDRMTVSEQSGAMYWSQAHELARERLNFAAASRVPVTLFVGRSGTGRTRLVRELIATNTSSFVVRVLNSLDQLSGEVFSDVLTAFNPKRSPTATPAQSREELIKLLNSLHAARRFPVLVVDDAEQLSNLYLGALCDLCDKPVDQRPLMKLVLVGRPDLADILSGVRPDLVGPAFALDCMSEEDIGGYVRARLDSIGLQDRKLSKGAVRELFVLSNGIPAKLNAICDALKKHGSSDTQAAIDKTQVRRIASLIKTPESDEQGSEVGGGQRHTPANAELMARANQVAGILQNASESDRAEPAAPEPGKRASGRIAVLAAGVLAMVGGGAYLYKTGVFSTDQAETPLSEVITGTTNVSGTASVLRSFSPGTAAEAEARVARIATALAGAESTANAQYLAALDLAETAPEAAAVGYARAALSGHERSAYYLGQIYETGEGVPVDHALARIWYNRAASQIAGAAARLEDLQPSAEGGAITAPIPLFSKKMPDGTVELIWTSGEGADPTAYRIELSSTFSDTALYSGQVRSSAIRLRPPQAARTWRVVALDRNGREVASPWMEIRLK